MSFRYLSRVLDQSGTRVVQGMKDQATKGDHHHSTIKSLRDSACPSSSKQARRFSGAADSTASKAAKDDKIKQSEESLRTVMYLSCWGPT